ncbi:MAG: EamA family transporter [Deltaproteobacteria bacterium]|nr:EamA family transporter [Deltaproteobacteria bacterium]
MDPALSVPLVLLSAILHAGWNAAIRRQKDVQAATSIVAVGSGLLAILGAFVLHHEPEAARTSFKWGLVAAAAEGCYFVALGQALRIGPLAAVYAISRGAPLLFLWPASHLLLGEEFGWRAGGALSLLLCGLVLLSPVRADQQAGTASKAGLVWALIVAVFNATYSLVYKVALTHGADVLVLNATSLSLASPLALLVLARQSGPHGGLKARLQSAFRAAPLPLIAGSVACVVSFLLALYAMQGRGAAWVSTLRNSSIAFAPLWGLLVVGERLSTRAWSGILLVFCAALLLGR